MIYDYRDVVKAIIFSLLLLSALGAVAPAAPIDTLIDALCFVESNNQPDAVGDKGLAVGILQIHPIMVKDVNRILGKTTYTLADRYDPARSRMMCRVYLLHYGGTMEEMARKWNGGPSGHQKECTKKYWEKVKRKL